MPYTILNKTYSSKNKLAEECKKILNKYNLKDVVVGEDIHFLNYIFRMHPDYDIKYGCGIMHVYVDSAMYGKRCFWIRRWDDTVTDISYRVALFGSGTKRSKVIAACREAVHLDILKYRIGYVHYGKTKCAISGEVLTKENCQIDHYDLTFSQLVNKWIANKDINALYHKINDQKVDGNTSIHFTDERVKNEFRLFHNSNTHLRAVTSKVNLQLAKNA